VKIAVLSPFYPYRGGIAQFSAMLYQALEEEHEVRAFSFSRLYPQLFFPGKTQYVESTDRAVAVPAECVLDSINPFSYQKTARAIERFQPDLLIIAYWMPFFAPAYGHIAARLKKKTTVIALLHNALPHEPEFFDKPLARLFFKQCKGFVVMSETVKKDLLALQPGANYLLQPHPLYDHFGEKVEPFQARKELGIDPGKKTLLFFGLIRYYKGLDLLIEALSLLDSSYQLVIAGEPYEPFDKYQKQIDASPAKDRIKVIARYISDSEVPRLFSASNLLVLPYRSTTQSGVVPVAYHFETPVLVTNVGSLREMIESHGTGIVCRPEAPDMAGGIEKFFGENPGRYIARIKEEKKKLSWEAFAGALVDFVQTGVNSTENPKEETIL
jgi:glycosyltransferase involved in cell wall biosynthesis